MVTVDPDVIDTVNHGEGTYHLAGLLLPQLAVGLSILHGRLTATHRLVEVRIAGVLIGVLEVLAVGTFFTEPPFQRRDLRGVVTVGGVPCRGIGGFRSRGVRRRLTLAPVTFLLVVRCRLGGLAGIRLGRLRDFRGSVDSFALVDAALEELLVVLPAASPSASSEPQAASPSVAATTPARTAVVIPGRWPDTRGDIRGSLLMLVVQLRPYNVARGRNVSRGRS
ncbi:hypothetical protein BJF89_06735 [Corynebacterium sp. CNJ-954]|uniref:hypothetical protein n=1 Tax=Corynebacterium sp. CNJ-954 TaxID=1904962 RepID=UPI000961C86E|nr:hypothetical protein [Corynebacterium sp. CNJ-954]OLT51422.1 hypothetical protein BJF89_06735 [Corynebacterium sp. CNJ-954]